MLDKRRDWEYNEATMKLSIDFGKPLEILGLEQAIKAVKTAGFDGIDFSFKDKAGREMLFAENWEECAWRVKKALDAAGLVCNQTHAPVGFSSSVKLCPKTVEMGRIIRSFRFSQILGAKYVVVHAVTDVKPVDFIPYNLRFYKLLEPYAKETNVKIAIENIFRFDAKYHRFEGVFETGEKLSSFIQKLRSPQFVACVDTGHAQLTGTPPERLIAGMNKHLVQCLHLHDNDGKDDLHLLPRSGAVDLEGVLSALKKIGDQGDITFEIMFFLEKFTAEKMPIALALAGEIGKEFKRKLS